MVIGGEANYLSYVCSRLKKNGYNVKNEDLGRRIINLSRTERKIGFALQVELGPRKISAYRLSPSIESPINMRLVFGLELIASTGLIGENIQTPKQYLLAKYSRGFIEQRRLLFEGDLCSWKCYFDQNFFSVERITSEETKPVIKDALDKIFMINRGQELESAVNIVLKEYQRLTI